MFGYVNELRSLTQGRATYTMQFLRYAQAPDSVRDKLVHFQLEERSREEHDGEGEVRAERSRT